MVVLSEAGNFRLVANFNANTMQLALEELVNEQWVHTENSHVSTLSFDGMRKLIDGANDAWGDDWR